MKTLFTSIWFPAALTGVAVVLLIVILCAVIRMLKIRRINDMPRHGIDFVYALLKVRHPDKYLFKRLLLIDDNSMFNIGRTGSLIKRECDIAYVGRGGILLLTVVPDLGCYDNPKTGNWKHSMVVKGQTVTQTIVNPFDATNPHLSAIETLLEAEGIAEKPITRAVIFTGKNVLYTTVYKEILSPGTLYDFVRRFDAQDVWGSSEIRRAAAVLQSVADEQTLRKAALEAKAKQAADDSSKPKARRNLTNE